MEWIIFSSCVGLSVYIAKTVYKLQKGGWGL